jgi:clan AA aspartic protease
MGAFTVDIELTNDSDIILGEEGYPRAGGIRRQSVRALVDTGPTVLVIPQQLRDELGLRIVDRTTVGIADGSVAECDIVGPVRVGYGDRMMVGTAVVMPGEVQILLGAVQMEEMDLAIDPRAQRLIPNPRRPDRARLLAVGVILRGPPSA